MGQQFPSGRRECHETEAAKCGASCVNPGSEASSLGAIETCPFFFLALMFLDEGGARWKDCGKGQEESADGWTEPVGNQPGQQCDYASKDEAGCIFAAFC